jgi:hypothetical protein
VKKTTKIQRFDLANKKKPTRYKFNAIEHSSPQFRDCLKTRKRVLLKSFPFAAIIGCEGVAASSGADGVVLLGGCSFWHEKHPASCASFTERGESLGFSNSLLGRISCQPFLGRRSSFSFLIFYSLVPQNFLSSSSFCSPPHHSVQTSSYTCLSL